MAFPVAFLDRFPKSQSTNTSNFLPIFFVLVTATKSDPNPNAILVTVFVTRS